MHSKAHTHTYAHTPMVCGQWLHALAVYGAMQTLVIIKITADTTDVVAVVAVQLNNK